MIIEHYKHITCFIPRNLDITNINGYNKRWHEKYIWLIHSIIFKDLTSEGKFGGYINLQKSLLRKYLGNRYTDYILNQLVNNKVIEINTKYSSGAFSKSYRLTPKYRSSKINSVKITKQTYCRKIAFMQESYLAELVKESPLVQYELLQCTYARIKKDEAIEYIKQKYDEASPQFKSRLISIYQYDAMHKATFTDGNWTNVGFTFKVNKGRIYSPCTMLARDLEQFTYFIGYEDNKNACMDMPNSQLCFFNELTKREYSKVDNIGSILNDNKNDSRININCSLTKNTPLIPSHIPSPYVVHFNTSWEDYIFNGLGYERMMFLTNWNGKRKGHTKEERQDFKAEFFGQLFYNKFSKVYTDMEQVFMTYHEKEAAALREVKERKGNKLLAIEVQRLEAKFFHTIIVDYMKRHHRGIPFTIKHDSITMPISEASYILDELNVLVRKFFNRSEIELKISEL